MIALGVLLLVLGFFLNIQVFWTIGVVLAVVGTALWILGMVGRPLAGRHHWY